MSEGRRNRLAGERSPYLLQHATNPVDWYPWGDDAFEAARRTSRPIFLSIGYSSCHWCHVMESECFENDEVAKLMNETFINIKVDREERPDVDSLYMKVCQMMTGGGGWPLTIIMTPERVPFWAGTYLPRTTRQGMIGMVDLIPAISKTWKEGKEEIKDVTVKVLEMLDSFERDPMDGDICSLVPLTLEHLSQDHDPKYGGFDGERKFPTPHKMIFLMRYWREHKDEKALTMALRTLDSILKGGIRDHVGGGFHRYSTDHRWHLPHFEKMLYDQALMLMALSEAYAITSNREYRRAAEELVTYVEGRLTSPDGGFYSSEDADAAGTEGSFYIWTYEELSSLLGPEELAFLREAYDVWESGNYRDEATRMQSGKNVLHLTSYVSEIVARKGLDLGTMTSMDAALKVKMRNKRAERPSPALDDKILSDWNGLMIAALCSAHRYLGSEKALHMAEKAIDHIERELVVDGELYHNLRDGHVGVNGFLDDHACLAWAHLEIYYIGQNKRHLERAMELTEEMNRLFSDREEGGFFLSREDPALLMRIKDLYDGAVPSGNSIAYYVLVQLAALFSDARTISIVDSWEKDFIRELKLVPSSYTMTMNGALMKESSRTLEVFGGADHHFDGYHPHLLTISSEHLEGMEAKLKGYQLCSEGRCLSFTDDKSEIERLLQ